MKSIDELLADEKLKSGNFQIEFKSSEIITRLELVEYLNHISYKIENLLQKGIVIIRWDFKDLSNALIALDRLKEEAQLSYRMISKENELLFIQVGEF